jgi:ABC-2 type transport system permease protein
MTVASARSFYRNRAALFWTLAFPVIFIVLFGSIFSGGTTRFALAWVDNDQTAASERLRSGFEGVGVLEVNATDEADALARMRDGEYDAVLVVPAGSGAAIAAGDTVSLVLYTDPSASTASTVVTQTVGQVVGAMNQQLSGRPPALAVETQPLQTQRITSAAYFVPSILAMALMQLGIFASIPLVAQREKGILKRLSATPVSRLTVVFGDMFVRLGIAALQTALIVGIGAVLFGVAIVGSALAVVGLIVLGALTFLGIGYVIASYARTEESANALTSVVQFPLMFLSGIFFPIAFMPGWLQPVAAFLPLTYLADALRQTMVGGAAYAPLWFDAAVLAGWLIGTFLISARFFRWQ